MKSKYQIMRIFLGDNRQDHLKQPMVGAKLALDNVICFYKFLIKIKYEM